MQLFPRKLLLYSIFFNEWKSVKLSLLVLTPPLIHITTRMSGPARGSVPEGVDCITVCHRPGDYTSGVSRTVGSVAISCNGWVRCSFFPSDIFKNENASWSNTLVRVLRVIQARKAEGVTFF